ncbi:DUF3618 domain-containing protein [Nonomuraea sp. NPDC005983]|uniref:DUF3618 domain-containing protein n=1 Tax=Nonomuraea sp. NPDC005983 TaxID=3155595 RepID=UPI0033B024B3
MSETDPGYTHAHAGEVGARRATVGDPTDHESINVPLTRAGASENAHQAEAYRMAHAVFDPEAPVQAAEEEAEVRKSIKEGRREVGGTVSALADKMDVKGRASDVTAVARGKVTEVADKVRDITPDQVKDVADKAAAQARKRPMMLLVFLAGVVAALVVRRIMRRRGR